MTLEEQYEQRKVVLDAIGMEARRLVDQVVEAGLSTATKELTLPGDACEWHAFIQVDTKMHLRYDRGSPPHGRAGGATEGRLPVHGVR